MHPSKEIATRAASLLKSHFGHTQFHLGMAPGRANLIGEHVDYNGGLVLPFAIDQVTAVAATRTNRKSIRIVSEHVAEVVEFPANDPARENVEVWGKYAQGVVALWRQQFPAPAAFDAAIASSLPVGAGLSSSAALCAAVALAVAQLVGFQPDLNSLAGLCQAVEHEYANVRCGIMDQFAVLGALRDHLLLLDCQSLRIEHIPFAAPEISLLVINSGVSHQLAESEYGDRRAVCESAARKLSVRNLRMCSSVALWDGRTKLTDREYACATHVVSEIERTKQAVAACRSRNWTQLGRLLNASHDSLREFYQVSCAELDLLVDLATPCRGVYGARLTGGGFGGSIIALVETSRANAIADHVINEYFRSSGIHPALFVTRPSDGAIELSAQLRSGTQI